MSEWTDEQLRAAAFAVMLDYSDNRANLHVGHRLLTLESRAEKAEAEVARMRPVVMAAEIWGTTRREGNDSHEERNQAAEGLLDAVDAYRNGTT